MGDIYERAGAELLAVRDETRAAKWSEEVGKCLVEHIFYELALSLPRKLTPRLGALDTKDLRLRRT